MGCEMRDHRVDDSRNQENRKREREEDGSTDYWRTTFDGEEVMI